VVEQQIHVKPGSGASRRYVIRFPDEKGDFSQDQEWFETEIDGVREAWTVESIGPWVDQAW